jgi:hypothetical protein
MLTLEQRNQWRSTAICGFIFMISTFVPLIISAITVGMGAEYLDAPLKGKPYQHLFENPEPAEYPWVALAIIVISIPFLLGGIVTLMHFRIVFFHESWLREVVYVCLLLGIMLSSGVILTHLYAELYAANDAEFRMALILNRLVVYLYFIAFSTIEIGLGAEILRTRILPRTLGWITILFGVVGLLIDLAVPNHNLPSVRILLNVPLFSLSIVIWSVYLWLLSEPRQAQTETPTTLGTRY